MGLDMYLTAKHKMYGMDKKPVADKVRKLFPEMYKTGNLDSVEVSFEAGYWRKANAIHQWLVAYCQDGKDECNPSYVSREKLRELLVLCKEVLENKEDAETLLPVQSGFFFGSIAYDEYYFQDIESTIEIINKCLELPEEWSFEYQSSW